MNIDTQILHNTGTLCTSLTNYYLSASDGSRRYKEDDKKSQTCESVMCWC